jgi:hypothetical protein
MDWVCQPIGDGLHKWPSSMATAQMALFHGHAATAIAYKFHCCQFILAHMFGIRIGCTAKAAFCIITTGAAQMPWFVSDGTARFACIGHYGPPLNRLTASLAEDEYSEGKSQEMRPIPPGYIILYN